MLEIILLGCFTIEELAHNSPSTRDRFRLFYCIIMNSLLNTYKKIESFWKRVEVTSRD